MHVMYLGMLLMKQSAPITSSSPSTPCRLNSKRSVSTEMQGELIIKNDRNSICDTKNSAIAAIDSLERRSGSFFLRAASSAWVVS